jgi:PPIC-type PPIASE domain
MKIRALLREPLVHFLAIGALLFVIGGVTGKTGSTEPERRIIVGEGEVLRLIEGFTRTWQRPPTRQELDGLIDDFIQEEIMYREALAMGLDRDDAIIRRRLRQKMEFLSEDVAEVELPSDEELQVYLDENPDKFRLAPRYSFTHAYFSVDRRGDAAQSDAARAVAAMNRRAGSEAAENEGDPFPLPARFDDMSARDVAGLFGREFAAALDTLDTGKWYGPIASGYGWHDVYVADHVGARVPELAEVRDQVERELTFERRERSNEEMYSKFREQYVVSVNWPQGLAPTPDSGLPGNGR